MEAKLAEYRARKLKDEHRSTTTTQRLLGFFRQTSSHIGEETQPKADLENNREPDNGTFQTSENHIADDEISEPPPSPGKISWLLFSLKILLWLVVWMIFIELQFGAVFFAVSALAFVYINTRAGERSKKKSLSAYSVFNPNCERLQGTITAEQFEAELLYRKPMAQTEGS